MRMKKLMTIQFAVTLAASLSVGGLADAQVTEASVRTDPTRLREAASSSPADANSSTTSISARATVFDYYFKIEAALAQDSLENIPVSARALAEIVRKDTTGAFPAPLANHADALAKATTLPGARQSFKAVSGYLIQYLRTSHSPIGKVHEVHCPMTNLNWLQTGELVQNPYLGKSMPRCGAFKS